MISAQKKEKNMTAGGRAEVGTRGVSPNDKNTARA